MKYRSYDNYQYYGLIGVMFFLLFGGVSLLISLIQMLWGILPILLCGIVAVRLMGRIRNNNRIHDAVQGTSIQNKRFIELLIHILIHVAKSDGHISSVETQTIQQFFRINLQFSDSKMIWINDLIEYAKKRNEPLSQTCAEFRTRFSYQSRLIALQLIYRVVMADNIFAQSEKQIVDQIVIKLEIHERDHQSVRSFFKIDQTQDDYYHVLGVDVGASADEIKRAYRKACKAHHPDRVHHLGPEIKKVAEEKMRKINEAYAALTKKAR